MKKLFIFVVVLFSIPNVSMASSAKCSAKAADVYYNNILVGDRDFILSGLRSSTGGKLSPFEITVINGLIYSCEKGIENQSYNSKTLWDYSYNDAKRVIADDRTARAYANAHVEMYEYGKSIR
ncbi:TPA: hypothetical protein N2E46_002517 [Salmonella enterica]|nr:hypothetical protein [Salmonella enterica]HCL4729805.1 hypothetical protein [Salmonella enterica]